MKNNIPAISVLMPVYNAERFLKDAIESILKQSFQDYEFIIIDDGSTDSSLQTIKNYSDGRIRLIESEHKGFVTQLNYGLEIAKSDIVARMDADDISLSTRFELQYSILKDNPFIGVVSSSYQLIDINGKKGAIKWLPVDDENIRNMIPVFCPICHGASMYRRTLVIDKGGYDEKYFPNEDYELWLRLSDSTKYYNILTPQLFVRKHENAITQKYGKKSNQQRLDIALSYIAKESQIQKERTDYFQFQKSRCYYYYGSIGMARSILFSLIIKNPKNILYWRYFLPTLLGNLAFGWLRSSGLLERVSNIFRSKPHSTLYIRP